MIPVLLCPFIQSCLIQDFPQHSLPTIPIVRDAPLLNPPVHQAGDVLVGHVPDFFQKLPHVRLVAIEEGLQPCRQDFRPGIISPWLNRLSESALIPFIHNVKPHPHFL